MASTVGIARGVGEEARRRGRERLRRDGGPDDVVPAEHRPEVGLGGSRGRGPRTGVVPVRAPATPRARAAPRRSSMPSTSYHVRFGERRASSAPARTAAPTAVARGPRAASPLDLDPHRPGCRRAPLDRLLDRLEQVARLLLVELQVGRAREPEEPGALHRCVGDRPARDWRGPPPPARPGRTTPVPGGSGGAGRADGDRRDGSGPSRCPAGAPRAAATAAASPRRESRGSP